MTLMKNISLYIAILSIEVCMSSHYTYRPRGLKPFMSSLHFDFFFPLVFHFHIVQAEQAVIFPFFRHGEKAFVVETVHDVTHLPDKNIFEELLLLVGKKKTSAGNTWKHKFWFVSFTFIPLLTFAPMLMMKWWNVVSTFEGLRSPFKVTVWQWNITWAQQFTFTYTSHPN